MKTFSKCKTLVLSAALLLLCGMLVTATPTTKKIHVLILSGANNHDWKKTTPWLQQIMTETGLFEAEISENPDTLKYADLKRFSLLVSNRNNWPDTAKRNTVQYERDFERYVSEGGGALFFHAGGSSFYGWEGYQKISLGRWGKETFHKAPVVAEIKDLDNHHPITQGMDHFRIFDEVWERTEIAPGARAIGFLKAKNAKDGHPIDEPAIFVGQFGKGRCFYTLLGHDERALVNSGLKSLLLRAAQWCAGAKVTLPLPAEIDKNLNQSKPRYHWQQSDTTLQLLNKKEVVWQFNYNDRFRRPYFHPLSIQHVTVTSLSPPDHPWHLGLWFCWKYINHVNYWEYLNDKRSAKTGYQSEGSTDIVSVSIQTRRDFSADLQLRINYHPREEKVVMTEERLYHISAPASNGSYQIQEDHLFHVVADSVVLDRTPPAIRGGRVQGGYAGISCRFSQDFTEPQILNPSDSLNCRKCLSQSYLFTSLSGKKAGLGITLDPQYNLPTCSWYVINDPLIPFFYFSPGVIFDNKVTIKKGDSFRLRYTIQLMASPPEIAQLDPAVY
ncbi:MAG: PmoA family protein [Marinilabiliales bacterium]|nr:PmoA family protein [Marinilabiliales bacterium]